ncbi:hypothetical protein PFISCL1PPCAC_10383, partial [Pristionchus fissidentatus]
SLQDHTDNFEFSLSSKRLFVSLTGLDDIDELLLRSHFSNSGLIKSVTIERSARSGPGLYAIVTFESDRSADDAVDSVHILGGKTLIVKKVFSSEEVKKMTSEDVKVYSFQVEMDEKKITLDTLLDEVVEILTTKIYTVNRRLSGAVEIDDHDCSKRKVLERAGVEEGMVHKLISKVDMFSQECFAICSINKGIDRLIMMWNWIDKTSAEKFVYEDCGIAAYLTVSERYCEYRPKGSIAGSMETPQSQSDPLCGRRMWKRPPSPSSQ